MRRAGVTTCYLRVPTQNGMKVYEPLPGQEAFHAAREKYRWYVGGLGAGKTIANCVEAFLTSQEYPGSVGLIGRWTWSELTATTFATLRKIIPERYIADSVESQNKCYLDVYAPKGKVSRIWGRHLSNKNFLGSLELDWFGIDEGGLIPPSQGPELWRQIEMRLRGLVGPHRGWVTGTPRGKDWLWKQFIGHGYRDYWHLRVPTSQNKYLVTSYEQDARRTKPRDWQRRFLDGEFCEVEGLVYFNYQENIHVVAPFEVPSHWPLFLSMDWGLSDPCSAHLMTSDEAGNVFVVREYYEAGRLVSEQCQDVREMIAQVRPDWHLDWAVIDPSADRNDPVTGDNLLDQYRIHGLPMQKGNRDVEGGISSVLEALKVDPDRIHPVTGRMGSPRLHIASCCSRLREQLDSYRWGPDGKPMKGQEDHAVDDLRYGMMRRPHPAQPRVVTQMRPSAKAFWADIARGEGWDREELPTIGAGAGGRMVA